MLFNSTKFVIFFIVVFFSYWVLPHKFRWVFLFATSYYFYMNWNPRYIVLILFITVVTYFAALMLEKENRTSKRKLILLTVCISCLGILFLFKYFNFFSNIVVVLMNRLPLNIQTFNLDLILPVGISFYTLQALSYVIDIYKKKINAERNFGIYATFISFFPQLVAGPIERTSNLLPQIRSEKNFDYNEVSYGLKLMAWGYFKKLVIADNMAVYVDTVWNSIEMYKGFDLVIVSVFFTIQVYCDFSGYSDIAVGTAKMLGIHLMNNFKCPYFATSIKDFWNRWHISLSSWLKDYVYIPLGGNMCPRLRHYTNILITFLVSGLWHGANWTFVIWGGIHGLARVMESMFSRKFHISRIPKTVNILVVFVFCDLTWIFFRAETLSDTFYVLTNMFSGITEPSSYFTCSLGFSAMDYMKIVIGIILLIIYDFFSKKIDVIKCLHDCKTIYRWSVYVAIIIMIILFAPVSSETAFLYFQF